MSYVTYFTAQPNKVAHRIERSANTRSQFPNSAKDRVPESQLQAVNAFLDTQENAEVLAEFIEVPENRKNNSWPKLDEAIQLCNARQAKLIIAELGSLAADKTFSQKLPLITFYCCDQPSVTAANISAIHEFAQKQKELHGKKIIAGLQNTSAKSGNPNAAEVISKVNKPKIDAAIVFAYLIHHIIALYKRKGYSQRQMVKSLNEEGFTAPEGGKWVLSQLQKVLDRVRLNEIAHDARSTVEQLRKEKANEQQIADALNAKGISSIKRSTWDEAQVKKLLARLDQIQGIELINTFMLDLLPLLHTYRQRGLSPMDIIEEFSQAGLTVRQNQTAVA